MADTAVNAYQAANDMMDILRGLGDVDTVSGQVLMQGTGVVDMKANLPGVGSAAALPLRMFAGEMFADISEKLEYEVNNA